MDKGKGIGSIKMDDRKKERLTDNKLLEVYNVRWLSNHNLSSPCQIFWGNSPYIMINELYPDHFKEWEFKKAPSRLWTRKKRWKH